MLVNSINARLSAPIFALLCTFCMLHPGAARAISFGQIDTFEDGTLQGWQMGFSATTADHMTNVADGGPAGAGDHYLQVTPDSAEQFGGNRLTFFNRQQWLGDYTAAGITAITMDVNNFSSSEVLNLRLGLNGGFVDPTGTSIIGGVFSTSASILESGSGWTRITFSLRPEDLIAVTPGLSSNTPGNNVQATLANVLELRLLNSASPDWNGLPVTATLGIDNIHAVPLPPALTLFASGLAVFLTRWRKQNISNIIAS
jgi:hypothetical protein